MCSVPPLHIAPGWRLGAGDRALTTCGAEPMLSTVPGAERQVPVVVKLELSLVSHSHHDKAPGCWSG